MEHLDPTEFCWGLKIKKMNKPGKSQIRVFIALSLPDHVRKGLAQIQARVRSRGIKASWTKPENLHLTLKFLGNIQIQDQGSLISAMKDTMTGFPSFELSAGGLGVFPNVKKARVLWTGIGGRTDLLENIFKCLEGYLHVLGIKREKHRFSPHITLGRIKALILPAKLIPLIQECKDIRSRPFEFESLDLFKSELTPLGAIHTRLFQARINSD